jgi:GntR family transcriptional regulator, transcriptional repressor for pyruvate dehydrogenase complex
MSSQVRYRKPQGPREPGVAGTPAGRPRNLGHTVVQGLQRRIDSGLLRSGDKLPTESEIMAEFGVSRTVVREALSMLQAAGQVVTRHGIGTFVVSPPEVAGGFKVSSEQLATLRDVIDLLELRIALESECASLAAQRRTPEDLQALEVALDMMRRVVHLGEPAVEPDFRFHLEVARATHNAHFVRLMQNLGVTSIPRARLDAVHEAEGTSERQYLLLVIAEHEAIFNAIAAQDADTARATMRLHLANSRDRRRRAAALAQQLGAS